MSQKQRGAIARQQLWWMHWLMAACFLVIFGVGIYMENVPRGTLYRQSLFAVHRRFLKSLWQRTIRLFR